MARYLIDPATPDDLPVLIGAHTGERIGAIPLFGLVAADLRGRRLNPCDASCRVELEPVLAGMGLTLKDLCSRPRGPQKPQKPVEVAPLASHGLSAEIVEAGSRRLMLQAAIPEELITAALPEIVGARLKQPDHTVLCAFTSDRWTLGATKKVASGVRALEKAVPRAAIVEFSPLTVPDPDEQAHNVEALMRLASVTTDATLTRDGQDWPVIAGAQTTVLVADASGLQRLPARYVLAPFGAILPSNDPENFAPSVGYPTELQERDYRTDQHERLKVIKNGDNWESSLVLNSNPDAVNGPPITDAEGRVLGGNSRAMSMMRYAARNPQQYAAALRLALRNHCAAFGLEGVRADLERMMLVRVVEGVTDPRTISRALNRSLTLELGKGASSVTLGKLIPVSVLEQLAADVSDATLREILRDKSDAIISALRGSGFITAQNSPIYVTRTNELTTRAVQDIEDALVGLVVQSTDLYNLLRPKLLQLITRVAPALLAIESFAAYAEDIADARAALVDANAWLGLPEAELLRETNTVSMFGETERLSLSSPHVARWCLWWLQAARGPVIAARCLDELVRMAGKTAEGPDMFGGGTRDAAAMIEALDMQLFTDHHTVIESWREYIEQRIPFRPLSPQPSLFGRRGNPSYVPPMPVRQAAARALDVRASKPPSQRGGTPVGLARARDLSHGRPVSVETAQRMARYFARHEGDRQGASWSERGKGWQAWNMWGGDAGRAWADDVVRRHNPDELELEGLNLDASYFQRGTATPTVFAIFNALLRDERILENRADDASLPYLCIGYTHNLHAALQFSHSKALARFINTTHHFFVRMASFFDGFVAEDAWRPHQPSPTTDAVCVVKCPAARMVGDLLLAWWKSAMQGNPATVGVPPSQFAVHYFTRGSVRFLGVEDVERMTFHIFVRNESQLEQQGDSPSMLLSAAWNELRDTTVGLTRRDTALAGDAEAFLGELTMYSLKQSVADTFFHRWGTTQISETLIQPPPTWKNAPRSFHAMPENEPMQTEPFEPFLFATPEFPRVLKYNRGVVRISRTLNASGELTTQTSLLQAFTEQKPLPTEQEAQSDLPFVRAGFVHDLTKLERDIGIVQRVPVELGGMIYLQITRYATTRNTDERLLEIEQTLSGSLEMIADFFIDPFAAVEPYGGAWLASGFSQPMAGMAYNTVAIWLSEVAKLTARDMLLNGAPRAELWRTKRNDTTLLDVLILTPGPFGFTSTGAQADTFVAIVRKGGVWRNAPPYADLVPAFEKSLFWPSKELSNRSVHLRFQPDKSNAHFAVFTGNAIAQRAILDAVRPWTNAKKPIVLPQTGEGRSYTVSAKWLELGQPNIEPILFYMESNQLVILDVDGKALSTPRALESADTPQIAPTQTLPERIAPQQPAFDQGLPDFSRALKRTPAATRGEPAAAKRTTAKPERTTAKPAPAKPERTTAKPERTTAKPERTTAKPAPAKPERKRADDDGPRALQRTEKRSRRQYTAEDIPDDQPRDPRTEEPVDMRAIRPQVVRSVLRGVGVWASQQDHPLMAQMGPILLALADELRLAQAATRRDLPVSDQMFAHMYWAAHNPQDQVAYAKGLIGAAQAAILVAQGKPGQAAAWLQPKRRPNPIPVWAETLLQLARLVTALSAASAAGVGLNSAALGSDTLLPPDDPR